MNVCSTCVVALFAASVLIPSAHADDKAVPELPVTMNLPGDFAESPDLADPLLYKLRAEVHLGGLRSQAYARAWHSDRVPATLFVTWFVTQDAIEIPDVAIHSEFELLRTTPERVGLSPGDTERLRFETSATGQAATANLSWRHRGYQTETQVRALAFQTTEGHLYFIQTDCVYPMPEAATPAADAPEVVCRELLASIEPAKGVGALRPLQPGAANSGDSGGAEPMPATAPRLTLQAPGTQPMPAIAIQREHKRDYTKYLYVLGGVLLLVGFYFSARSRNASNAETGGVDVDKNPPTTT